MLLLLLTSLTAGAKKKVVVKKVSVTPSEAKISVDGNYVGDGVTEVTIGKTEGFVVLKFELEGYVTTEVKLFASDQRNAVSYTLRRDAFYDLTVESGAVNKYFAVTVSKDLYTEDGTGKRNTEKAWKMIHQVLLNYFDEIQTTDFASGFVQTPWKYNTLAEADKVIRTRVSVKESNLGGDLTFQIKVSSEAAPLLGSSREEAYREVNRVIKEMEPLVSEFQTRLGKR